MKSNVLYFDPLGAMYPTSMHINEEGRLVVYFKTEARFRGQFVMSHPGMRVAPTRTVFKPQTHPVGLNIYKQQHIGLLCG